MNKPEEFPKIYERKETGASQGWRQPYPTDGLTTDLAFTSLQTRFKTIVQSPVFEFLVGRERKPMTIHKALVAAQSAALRGLVTGSMEEANSGKVVWEDVDEDTFVLFAEFLYTGDYATPLKTGLKYDLGYDDSDDIYDSDMDEGDGPFFYQEDPFMTDLLRPRDSSEGYGKNKEGVNNGSDSPKDSEEDDKDWEDYDNDDSESNDDYPLQQTTFSKLRFSCPWDPPEIYCAYSFQQLDEQRKSECTSLLSHARVYVLADRYNVPRLKNIAVQKLQKTLSQLMPIEEEFYDYIADLINFVYENTPPLSTTKEPLRQLVTHYVSYPELRMFVKSKRCVTLMRECEPFAVDLREVLMKRRDRFWSPRE